MEKRILDYGEAINEAHRIALRKYPNCFVIGQGVNNPWFVGKTTTGLVDEFGAERVMDSPVSANHPDHLINDTRLRNHGHSALHLY